MKGHYSQKLSHLPHLVFMCLVILLPLLCQSVTWAGNPYEWFMGIGPTAGPYSSGGTGIGVNPRSHDGWDGLSPVYFWYPAVNLALYREHSADWGGDTGFYLEDYESPIASGGSKTWWDFYLWSDVTLPSNEIDVVTEFEASVNEGPPPGYIGNLVIDQVAAGVTWTGPMEYWFDMTQFNTFTLPIATVTDPLQGTRFHLTVYAPVPEPSSLAGLGLALVGLAAAAVKRRR